MEGLKDPDGNTISLSGGSTAGPGAGSSPAAVPEDCTLNEDAYYGSPAGTTVAFGQFAGTGTTAGIRLVAGSRPQGTTAPYPFDVKARLFQDCGSVEVHRYGSQPQTWTLDRNVSERRIGDASYAVAAFTTNQGVPEWRVLVGARTGLLSAEGEGVVSSKDSVQHEADVLAGLLEQVLARAGQ